MKSIGDDDDDDEDFDDLESLRLAALRSLGTKVTSLLFYFRCYFVK